MTDTEIIAALQKGGAEGDRAWEYMYKNWGNAWRSVVTKLGGTPDDADDALASAYANIMKAVGTPGFHLESAGLLTYIVTCVRNAWLALNKSSKKTIELEDKHLSGTSAPSDADMDLLERDSLLDQVLAQIGSRCQTILTLWVEGYSMKEIAASMGFGGGELTARKEKYKCWLKLMEYLKVHPVIFNRLKDFLK